MVTESLAGTAAIVTGASAGIGKETARVLAADGADVTLVARREERLRELADEIESETDATALVCPADVSDESDVEAVVEQTVSTFGKLDVLVNNAGIATTSETTVEEFPTDQYRTVMGVNVDGMFYAARAAIPHLRETDGTLLFVASAAGKNPRSKSPIYAATKWWTRGFAKSLAGQVGTDDIAVSIVNPSEVRTEFGKEYREKTSEERFEPGEVTGPRAIAEAIAFAARQETPNAVTELDLFRRDKYSSL
ncbi:SDR family oxidoreductase [Natrinema caseinilyticum]|uniref:SDR family oxidoreductase n=1 Tax=Natrinema caseinilyticum TaxID=2961570 RepID=UPI0020C352C1|nr:SDR family oxidoreductase [Natrinema caseinilyticum]